MVIEVNFYIASVLWLPADQFANLGFGLTRVASLDRKIFVVWLWFFYYKFINLLSCKNVATVEKTLLGGPLVSRLLFEKCVCEVENRLQTQQQQNIAVSIYGSP